MGYYYYETEGSFYLCVCVCPFCRQMFFPSVLWRPGDDDDDDEDGGNDDDEAKKDDGSVFFDFLPRFRFAARNIETSERDRTSNTRRAARRTSWTFAEIIDLTVCVCVRARCATGRSLRRRDRSVPRTTTFARTYSVVAVGKYIGARCRRTITMVTVTASSSLRDVYASSA